MLDYEQQRQRMVARQLKARGLTDKRLLEAFANVERHLFMPEKDRIHAYEDGPFPIGEGQTISQPFIVALMTSLLQLDSTMRVLEIGTGSGYQTAILAELVAEVFSVERISALSKSAQQRLNTMGYTNIHFAIHDGTQGWKEFAPYDAILVTAAAPQLPQSLFQQCADGGRIVAPVGEYYAQELLLWQRVDRTFTQKNYGGCCFVPLIGENGW